MITTQKNHIHITCTAEEQLDFLVFLSKNPFTFYNIEKWQQC